ncbi:Uncharacterized protein FWK35_00028154 [Aphis craccivora]|uniref:Uncharacterized protein n=1 Tax=Aphis craccivora TaxID=307492 RepID=A0A6G0XRG8_APHCR|nr:Uncharacterized protein FWK35_00028154 [Aphis craccivora]
MFKIYITKKHDICTVEQNKKALSVYDDKRFILDNGIDTLAWGHYKTNIDRNDFELGLCQEWYLYTTYTVQKLAIDLKLASPFFKNTLNKPRSVNENNSQLKMLDC